MGKTENGFFAPLGLLQTLFNPSRNKAVAVTGLGCVTSAGSGLDPLWAAVREERPLINQDGFAVVDVKALGGDGLATPFFNERRSSPLAGSRFALMTLHAVAQAMRDAGWSSLEADDGVILGTTTGNILLWEPGVIALGRGEITSRELADCFAHEPLGLSLDMLCELMNFRGRAQLVSSACSSSTQALALGALWLRSGRVKRCLIGGAEVLCRLTSQGFQSLQLLSKAPATPFDQDRSGINLAEGAGFVCLERADASPRRVLGLLSGFGFSSDAYHMTAPHPEGRGCFQAMQSALESAQLSPAQITWVHAHGTGSSANDLAEGLAIERLFGPPEETAPFVSSTKGVHGHALAASGIIEVMLCLRALQESTIVRTCGLKRPDPRIKVRHAPSPENHRHSGIRHILKNSLGFGGSNASVVLSHPAEQNA